MTPEGDFSSARIAAVSETAAILADEKSPSGVIHCFSTGRLLAERALTQGFYVSLSGIVTFRNAEELRATARDIPLDRLLIETDAPAYVVHTANFLAELLGVAPDELARRTSENFFRLFTKAQRPEAA